MKRLGKSCPSRLCGCHQVDSIFNCLRTAASFSFYDVDDSELRWSSFATIFTTIASNQSRSLQHSACLLYFVDAMNLVHAPTPSSHPLFTRTNTPRLPKVHFKLPAISKKGVPTVSLTNTNAARTTDTSDIRLSSSFPSEVSPQSSIPFPSSPIPCPSPRKRAASEEHYDFTDMVVVDTQPVDEVLKTKMNPQTAAARQVSRTDIARRRHKSCLTASYFHHDSYLARKAPPPPPPTEKPASTPSDQFVKRPVARRESMSAGTPTGKNTRKARRLLADAQFLACLHASIASQVPARKDATGACESDFVAQDILLVERIWHTLVDMGYKPVPMAKDPPVSATIDAHDPAREAAERAARRTTAATSTPISADRVQDIPLTLSGVLSMPKLVAVLIMRHRDRTSSRPRSAYKKRIAMPPPSPLSSSTSRVSAEPSSMPLSG
ncbi:hypothetical protein PYCCODRAFT_1435843 [Trametes coccinea BRFM310]|uniref:Uncharacterized protein n=1 Tax=Trametes coccinea (strain BRFM310) TaxID=1353009 RepID=A0A1Y2IM09_TRAC3|nr:hypothetical protein PYCCODRAFT_1435843 [Trametes coccinea BRFM310]